MNQKTHSILRRIYHRIPGPARRMVQWIYLRPGSGRPPIYGLSFFLNTAAKPVKRALLSYITLPLKLKPDDPRSLRFSSNGIACAIVRVLNELGYIVDVVEYTDTKFIPSRSYDIFVGHGGYNFERIAKKMSPDIPKIYFSAGPYWEFWNGQETARVNAMRARRGVDYSYERLDVSEESAVSHADAIIALGNNFVAKTYGKFPRVFTLNNAAFHDNHYDVMEKDFAAARRNFLFFSGGGNVHKGLDILIEAFAKSAAHLYVCQDIAPGFYRAYRRELENAPNIHLLSLTMRTPQFYEIADKCAFLIYPTCADGSPGAVIECMHQGIIPVLSREAAIDIGDYGVMLNDCSIKEVAKIVGDLSQRSAEWCQEMSRRTRKAALSGFSEENFLKNMKKAIRSAVEREPSAKTA